jgi:hypothetical protein
VGYWWPSGRSATNTALTTWVDAEMYSSKVSLSAGGTMTGGVVRKVFNSSSAWSASSIHLNLSNFFSSLKKG